MKNMGKGRPEGSKTTREIGTVELSRCPKCNSTERTPYRNKRESECGGKTLDGKPFTHVVWQSTTCAKCGQHRTDKTYENRDTNAAEKSETNSEGDLQ